MSQSTAAVEVTWNGTTDGYQTGSLFRYGPAVDDSNKVFKQNTATRSWEFTTNTATYTAIGLVVLVGLGNLYKYSIS